MRYSDFNKILIFLLIFIFFNFCINIFSKNIIKKITRDDIGIVNKVISDKSDILILGSSRARNHYNSKLIAKELGQSVFNGGVSGMGLAFNKFLFVERIKRHLPQKLILDIAPNILADRQQTDKIHAFYSFLDIYPSFNQFMESPKFVNVLVRNLPCLKYNSSLYECVTYFLKPTDLNDSYSPLHGNYKDDSNSFYYVQSKESSLLIKKQVEILRDIIEVAKFNNIEIFLVVSPSYKDFDNNNLIKKTLINVANENKVSIINFSNSLIFKDRDDLFYNQLHLNSTGAQFFSRAIVDTLRKRI